MDDPDLKLVKLAPAIPPGQADIVQLLERMLADAQAGKILAVIGVQTRTGGAWSQFHAGDIQVSQAVGMLEIAKHIVINDSRL